MYRVEQYVMAYQVADHSELKKILPEGFASLRPVLRINAELIGPASPAEESASGFMRAEFNTPVEYGGTKGWLNLATWENRRKVPVCDSDPREIPTSYADIEAADGCRSTSITAKRDGREFLNISFTRVGKEGGCPKEDDNEGTFYLAPDGSVSRFKEVERIDERKEFCDCRFLWSLATDGGLTPQDELVRAAMAASYEIILGAYVVSFDRKAAATLVSVE